MWSDHDDDSPIPPRYITGDPNYTSGAIGLILLAISIAAMIAHCI